MNAVLQFGAGYRTYIIAAVLVLVVVVEKGLGSTFPASMSGPTGSPTSSPRSASAPCAPGSRGEQVIGSVREFS